MTALVPEKKGAGSPEGDPATLQLDESVTATATDTHQSSGTQTDLRIFFDALYGDSTGFVHVAYAADPYVDKTGKVKHEVWSEQIGDRHAFDYPADADAAIRKILELTARKLDVYVSTSLMSTRAKRTKATVVGLWCLHADCDTENVDLDEIRALGGCAVASGTPSHVHGYIPLSESVTPAQFEALEDGLIARLRADSKKAGNDVLRPPGTKNFKATARRGKPTAVEWVIRPTGQRVDPRVLAEKLGVDLDRPKPKATKAIKATKAVRNGQVSNEWAETEVFDLHSYPSVKAALKEDTGDRSVDTMRVVGACYDSGLTLPHARYAVSLRPDLVERLEERNDDDIERCWEKVADNRQAQGGGTDASSNGEQPAADRAPSDVHRGQARMAYRVAESYCDRLLNVCGLGWHRWDQTHWAFDDRGEATRAVLAELRSALAASLDDKDLRADVRKCESASGVAGVLDLAAALEPFATAVADLDADAHLLNVANGTLDLHALNLRPHSPADRITKVCRGAYVPGALSPLWDAFLARVLPDDKLRGFVQRLVGVALLGKVIQHELGIATGTGANGKTVFDKTIRFVLGDYAIAAEPDLFMHREGAHPTGEMDLRGVRWVSVSESDRDRRLAEATMKRLTGGDTIRARRMRQDFVEFEPSHTALLITNHLPRVSGDDPAIWRRLRVIPFGVVIPEDEQDKELDARLQLEADGILGWAVAGYRDYLTRGLAEPPSVSEATKTYQQDSDAVRRFVDDECVTSGTVKSTTSDLHTAWERWRFRDGAEPMSQKAFGQALDRLGYPAGGAVRGKRWRKGIAPPEKAGFATDDE